MAPKNGTVDTQAAPVELLNVDPSTLTLEANVRTLTDAEQANIDDLATSIAEVGVYTPLRGVRDQAGEVMVRDGQRRLLAAQQAGVATVPVVIHAEDADGDEREAARISQQVLANSGRALTGEDTAAAIDQLSMFGVSADQIATRTGVDKDTVDATVATADSATARAQVIEYDLTLEQAAALVEFEDDERAVRWLTDAARRGDFDHTLQRLRQAQADAAARADAEQPYHEQGIGVLVHRPFYDPETPQGDKLYPLGDYVTADGQRATTADVAAERLWVYLSEDETYYVAETGEPVDSMQVDWEWTPDEVDEDGEPVELPEGFHDPATIETRPEWIVDVALTTNPKADGLRKAPKNLGPVDPDADPEQAAAELEEAKEKQRTERRQLIALNKAADAAQVVRREHVTQLLTRKTPPKGAAKITAATVTHGVSYYQITDGVSIARELLGLDTGYAATLEAIDKASDNRAQVITLAHALGAYEHAYGRSAWRDNPTSIKPYIEFLVSTGYTPAAVETIITGERTAAEAYEVITAEPDADDTADTDE